jgi:hypothetical protein
MKYITDILKQYENEELKIKVKDIIIDFNVPGDDISLPIWVKSENLNMVIGAGDCVIGRLVDIERLGEYNIFVCLPEAPIEMIVSNINYIIDNNLNKIICFINLLIDANVEKFIKTFENKINMIGFGGAHFIPLPNHQCFGRLLKLNGYSKIYIGSSHLICSITDMVNIKKYIDDKYFFKFTEEHDLTSKDNLHRIYKRPFTDVINYLVKVINDNKTNLQSISNFNDIYNKLIIPDSENYVKSQDYFRELFEYIYNLMFIATLRQNVFDIDNIEYTITDDRHLFVKKIANLDMKSDGKFKRKFKKVFYLPLNKKMIHPRRSHSRRSKPKYRSKSRKSPKKNKRSRRNNRKDGSAEFRAVSGMYVTSDRRVYDVTITDNSGNKIATVGFTPTQKLGAIFWENYDMSDMYYEKELTIKQVALSYAKSQGVSWL